MTFKFKTAKQAFPGTKGPRFWLHQHHSGIEAARPLDTVHASDLTNPKKAFCARYYALADILDHKPKNQWVTTSEAMTWRIGRRFQDDVVNDFADMKRAIGHWGCLSCDRVELLSERPESCAVCGCRAFKPVEVRITSSITGASFGCDCLFLVEPGKTRLRIVEIKTMREEDFKDLKSPLAEHRVRTNLGLDIVRESGMDDIIDPDVAYILYMVKSGYGSLQEDLKPMGIKDRFSPMKEFMIRYDGDDEDLKKLRKRASMVKAFRDKLYPPGTTPTGVCMHAKLPRAQACELCASCFSGKYPQQVDP